MLMFTAFIAAIVAGVVFVATLARQFEGAIKSSYHQEWVVLMCIEHMKANNNEWPKCWDDLRDDYQDLAATYPSLGWTFEELMSDVEVDWDISQEQFLAIDHDSEFNLIWRSGHSEGRGANCSPHPIVMDYLKSIPPPPTKPRVRF